MHISINTSTNISSHNNADIGSNALMIILIRRLVLTIVLIPVFILRICPFPVAPFIKQLLTQKVVRGRVVEHTWSPPWYGVDTFGVRLCVQQLQGWASLGHDPGGCGRFWYLNGSNIPP